MGFKKFLALFLICSTALFAFSGCTLVLIGVGIVSNILGNEPTEAPTEAPTELTIPDITNSAQDDSYMTP